jgi:hypothetical protein
MCAWRGTATNLSTISSMHDIADLEAENVACIRTLELRKKQYALLLLQVVIQLTDV